MGKVPWPIVPIIKPGRFRCGARAEVAMPLLAAMWYLGAEGEETWKCGMRGQWSL